jgi:hypothetical protein
MKIPRSPSLTAALAALALLALAPRGQAQAAADLKVTLGQTVEITRSHSWCWFPTIHKFRSGELLVGMVLSPDQINSESAVSAYCLSRDGGLTWSRRYTMGQGANQDGAWSEAPDANDQIWQIGSYPESQREGDPTHFFATLTKYGRGGRFSSEDRDVTLTLTEPAHNALSWLFDYRFDGKVLVSDTRFTTQFHWRPWGNIVTGAHGELYCSAYFTAQVDSEREESAAAHSAQPRHAPRFNRDVLLRSTDGGRSWTEHGRIAVLPAGARAPWVGFEGFNEGSLAVLPDGRLYAVYRTGGSGGMIGHGWSSDGGKTWTEPASMGFAGVAPRVHRLSNGMLVLVTGRPGPVVLRFNVDGTGKEWSHPITIYSDLSTRYTDVAEVSPGKLLVVYDHVPYGWFEIPFADRDARNIIYGTFVTVSKN